jgi:PKD repeat protein
VFATPGTYTVKLTAVGPHTSDEYTQTIEVRTPPAPSALFSALLVPNTLTVEFTDTSSGHVSSWLWDFGDGTTSTEQHPTHSFELDTVNYMVRLTVTGLGGSSQASHLFDFPMPAPPVASFTASPTSGSAPLTVQFTDTSTGAVFTTPSFVPWAWDFGDGTTSGAQHPTHTYTTPGVYTVKLIRYGSGGGDDFTGTITVSAP